MSFRLQQCFNPFAMLSIEGSSETRLFRHLSDHVFQSRYFEKYICYEGVWGWSLFGKCLKINIDFKNPKKKWEKVFCFWDTCIWICGVKLLDQSLKSRVSEDPSIHNMTNGSKQWSNLDDSTFTTFINHCKRSSTGKSLFWWYTKS